MIIYNYVKYLHKWRSVAREFGVYVFGCWPGACSRVLCATTVGLVSNVNHLETGIECFIYAARTVEIAVEEASAPVAARYVRTPTHAVSRVRVGNFGFTLWISVLCADLYNVTAVYTYICIYTPLYNTYNICSFFFFLFPILLSAAIILYACYSRINYLCINSSWLEPLVSYV